MSLPLDNLTMRARTRVGQVLRGKWRLDQLIGVGGMASVYAATHRNNKRGAVKMLHPELGADEEIHSRFLREGYVANNVGHPGVVSVLDDDVAEDGSVFLVMELLDGQTVDSLVESRPGKRLQLGEVLAITDELLDVLAAAHAKGIVHRDLKPENLFLTRKGEIKVLDFGIARMLELAGTKGTATGLAMGTPTFMPPEQAQGVWTQVDARSDLWAVGATMFTLLSGQTVHMADNVQKLLLAAMTKPARPIGSVVPDLPPGVCAIVDCALAFDRTMRWPDARAMQQAVRTAKTGVPNALRPEPPPAPPTVLSSAGTPPAITPPAITPPAHTPPALSPPFAPAQSHPAAFAPTANAPPGVFFPPVQASSAVGLTASPVSRTAPRARPSSMAGALVAVTLGVAVLGVGGWLVVSRLAQSPDATQATPQPPEAPAPPATPAQEAATPAPTPSAVASEAPSAPATAAAAVTAPAPTVSVPVNVPVRPPSTGVPVKPPPGTGKRNHDI